MTLTAAADGSALSNPGPMGWAWYIDDGCWAAGGAAHGTNNQGELLAVRELLVATASVSEPLLIECDSRYVIDSVTKWMPGWKKRGWRKADGGPVLNRELLEGIDAALRGRDVTFTWVKGHAGHPRNEAADVRANAAATAYRDGREPARGPGFVGSADAAGAAAPAATPVATSAPVTQAVVADAAPAALWDDELLAAPASARSGATTRVTLDLTPDEHARLLKHAAKWGVSADEALRRLI